MSEQRRRHGWHGAFPAAAVLAALLAVTPTTPSRQAASAGSTALSSGTLSGGSGNGKGNGTVKPTGGGTEKKDFTISGTVSGLYPGSSRPLVVTLANPNNFDIQVTSMTATVADPTGPCTAGAVRVDPLAAAVVVPKNGTAAATLTARMSDDSPDDCKSTSFALTYQGTAVKA